MLYSLDTRNQRIIRHGTNAIPYATAVVPNETYARLMIIRDGLVALMSDKRDTLEISIDAWQDVLSVYFAHWEE